MKYRTIWASFALSALISTGAVARGDDVEAELKKLEGEWTAASAAGGEVSYKFKGKTLNIGAPSRSYTMTITVDPKAKPHKTIDFKIDEAPEDAKGKTSLGIYKFEGDDTLVLCFRGEGERAAKFEQSGFEQILTTLKKKKGDAAKPEPKKPTSTANQVAPNAADARLARRLAQRHGPWHY